MIARLLCRLGFHGWVEEISRLGWTVYGCDRCGTRKWVVS